MSDEKRAVDLMAAVGFASYVADGLSEAGAIYKREGNPEGARDLWRVAREHRIKAMRAQARAAALLGRELLNRWVTVPVYNPWRSRSCPERAATLTEAYELAWTDGERDLNKAGLGRTRVWLPAKPSSAYYEGGLMPDKPIAKMIRARWGSPRPYSGTASETLLHKLKAGALDATHQELAVLELARRKIAPDRK